MKNIIVLLLAFIVLISCSSIPSGELSADKFKLNEDEGGIAGVIGILKKTYSSNSNIYYTNDEIEKLIKEDKYNKYKYRVFLATSALAPQSIADFEKDKKDPYVYFFFILKQKPGNYKFNAYSFFFNSGYIQENVEYEIQPNIDFNIEKGKIKYFGTIFLNSKTRQISHTKEFKEYDIQKFKEKLSHIVIE